MKQIFLRNRRFAYDILGTGSKSVILETGFGAKSSEWESVASKIEKLSTVFLYDRAGRGQSDPPSGPRDAMRLHHELNALLEATGVRPPFVLVGHSFGGVLMRLFADARRNDVCGLVLVESMHHQQFEAIGPVLPEQAPDEPAELTKMREFWRRGWMKSESTPELIDLATSLKQDETVQRLGALPLHVITAASFRNIPFLHDELAKDRLQGTWDNLQNGLLTLSSEARHTYLNHSGHFVQRDAPSEIVEAITPFLVQRKTVGPSGVAAIKV